MTAQTAKTLEIVLTETTDMNNVFAAEADMDGVDMDASMARYDDMLLAEVTKSFPEAEVSVGPAGRIIDLETDGNPWDSTAAHEAGLVVQQIADAILNGGDWIVMDASSCCDQCGTQCGAENLTKQSDGAAICGACEFSREQA